MVVYPTYGLVSRISEPVVTFSGRFQKSKHQMGQGSPPERVPTVGAAAGSAKGTTSKRVKGRGPIFSDTQQKILSC